MKRRPICHRGCPTDRETHYQCIAIKGDGRLCRKPAGTYDPARGGFICERHSISLIAELRAEAGKEQAA